MDWDLVGMEMVEKARVGSDWGWEGRGSEELGLEMLETYTKFK